MIVSITFRHGTENRYLRNWINTQCFEFEKYTQDITRVQVVISRISHHKNSTSNVQCHISIHAAGRKYIDVYENNGTEGVAFNRAYDRICSELSQLYSGREFHRHSVISFLKNSKLYFNALHVPV
ncbi:MAG: HPF/RaiA family ribosome-associated protein [Methylococcales bacterium]